MPGCHLHVLCANVSPPGVLCQSVPSMCLVPACPLHPAVCQPVTSRCCVPVYPLHVLCANVSPLCAVCQAVTSTCFVPACPVHVLCASLSPLLHSARGSGWSGLRGIKGASKGPTCGRTSPCSVHQLMQFRTFSPHVNWWDNPGQLLSLGSPHWLQVISLSGTSGGIPNKQLVLRTRCGEIDWNSWLRDTTFTNYKSYANFHKGWSLLHTHTRRKHVGLLPQNLGTNSVDIFLGIGWKNSMSTPSIWW